MSRNSHLLIGDMLESCKKILRYTEGMSQFEFIEDDKTLDAVVRNLEIIGEASNRIDENFKEEHQEVDWIRIRGLRNRIVHEYFGIDYEIVWNIISHFVPDLLNWLERLDAGD